MVRKTTSEYIQQLEELYPGKYEVLSEYKTNEDKVHIRYKKCGHEKWIKASGVISRGSDCQICTYKENFYRKAKNKHGNNFDFPGDYKDNDTPIIVKCKKCGCEFTKTPHHIINSPTMECPKCGKNPNLLPYINDIWCTNPNIAKMLADPEDGHKFKANSTNKTWFICQDCGSRVYKMISEVTRNGKPTCTYCSDGISYPEKFMANILKQLNIIFVTQFSPEWAKPYYYDFMFELNNKKIIIEMDGGLGHGNNKGSLWCTPEESKNIDYIKDARAMENGFKLIRIDCNYKNINTRHEFIKNNIITSYLSKILDFSNVDFNECETNSVKSTISEIADIWNNGVRGIENIKNKMTVPKYSGTIRSYLKKACELNLINEPYEIVSRENFKSAIESPEYRRSNIHMVKCLQTDEIFYGYKTPDKKYKSNLKQYFSNIKRNRNIGNSGGCLSDGTKLDWIIVDEESA